MKVYYPSKRIIKEMPHLGVSFPEKLGMALDEQQKLINSGNIFKPFLIFKTNHHTRFTYIYFLFYVQTLLIFL